MPNTPINASRRKNLNSLTKAFITSGVVVAGGGAFPVMAQGDPWTEIARGIAQGIARFTEEAFKALTDFWTDRQKESNDKATIAKGQAMDNRIDFRVQLENLRRVNRIKPTTSLCNKEPDDVQHHHQVEAEKEKRKSAPSTTNTLGANENVFTPNRGVTHLGNRSGKFDLKTFLEQSAKLEQKAAKGEPFTEHELAAYTKLHFGNSAAETMAPIRNIARQDENIASNPALASVVNQAMVNVAANSYATKLFVDTQRAQAGNFVMLDQVEQQTMKRIGSRYQDQRFLRELTAEQNEVALISEYVRLVGEHIYTLNSRFRQNQKLLGAMAIQIIVNDRE